MYGRGEEMSKNEVGLLPVLRDCGDSGQDIASGFEYEYFEDMQSNFRQIGGWEQKADFETRWK